MPAGRLIVPDDGAVIDYEQMPAGVFDAHPALASA
jgi:hypothetical protein